MKTKNTELYFAAKKQAIQDMREELSKCNKQFISVSKKTLDEFFSEEIQDANWKIYCSTKYAWNIKITELRYRGEYPRFRRR